MLRFFHVFPSFDAGGLEVRALQLMALIGPDVSHSVVALDNRTGALSKLPASVRFELVPPPRARHTLGMTMTMADAMRIRRPDLVLTYNWGAIESIAAARLIGARAVIHHEDGFGPEESGSPIKRRIYARRCLLPSVRALVVPSMRLADMAKNIWHQPPERIHYFPNGVDVDHFTPKLSSTVDSTNEVVIGHVGRFRPEKNQVGLLRAYAANPILRAQARLLFVGDGPELAAAKALSSELGIDDRVTFAGVASNPAPFYQQMDIFTLSSTTEQMPLSVLEAMATGLPIVSTAVGDVVSMLAEPNRELVVPSDRLDLLADTIAALVNDPKKRQTLGAANRAHAEQHFRLDACLGRWIKLYRSLAARPADSVRADPR